MEEEMTMTVEGKGEPGSSEESAVEMPTKKAQDSPKKGRGRPKRKPESSKNEEEENVDSSSPRKRGRPKGSPNKKPKLAERREVSSEQESSDSSSDSQSPSKKKRDGPWRRYKSSPRGTPKKDIKQKVPGSSLPAKRGRGRPKGSPTKTVLASGDPVTPKVWGRPRKYPKAKTPPPPPTRGRGRPRKTDERRGVHLRRAPGAVAVAKPKVPSDASPRRRGRPLGSVKSPRGRPKGSPNKAKAASNSLPVDDVPAEDDQEERSQEEESQDDAGQAEEGGDAGQTEEGGDASQEEEGGDASQEEEGDSAGQEEEGDNASQEEEGDDAPAEANEKGERRRPPRGRAVKKSKRIPPQSEGGEPHVGGGRRSSRIVT